MVQTSASVDPSSEVAIHFDSETKLFNALQLMGLIGSIISLVAALFSSVPRQATWYNFFSSLNHAASPFSAACALALVIQLYLNIQATLTRKSIRGTHYYWYIMASIGNVYLENPVPGKITAAFVVVLVVPILVVNLLIYLAFRKHSSFLLEKNHTSMFVRVSIFTLFGLVSAIVGLIFFFLNQINSNSRKVRVGMNIILAIIPVAAVLVFGTHKSPYWSDWQYRFVRGVVQLDKLKI
ncbi:hypothetical protein GG344DRAFT_61374 [Lentinula edodes]|nr:hypothetical protein GG344DRAFT_61374 [Lentinula edodes]